MAAADDPLPTSLAGLFAAPKGRLTRALHVAFILHVFWEAPSAAAATRLLGGLAQCARATREMTPCVPTYVFRVTHNDDALCAPPPRTVGEHPHLRAARKKLEVGIPAPAVRAELTKRGIDPTLLDAPEGDAAPLPEALQAQPVRVEFTELYLDERAFVMHAGSREYLDGHAVVTHPAMHYSIPTTLRVGTPPAGMIEKILDPVLHARDAPVLPECFVWRQPATTATGTTADATEDGPSAAAVLLSLDVGNADPTAVAAALPTAFRDRCSTCLVFAHPLRDRTARVLAVVTDSSADALAGLAALKPARGEAHCAQDPPTIAAALRTALDAAGLALVTVNASERVGYVLHQRARDLQVLPE